MVNTLVSKTLYEEADNELLFKLFNVAVIESEPVKIMWPSDVSTVKR